MITNDDPQPCEIPLIADGPPRCPDQPSGCDDPGDSEADMDEADERRGPSTGRP